MTAAESVHMFTFERFSMSEKMLGVAIGIFIIHIFGYVPFLLGVSFGFIGGMLFSSYILTRLFLDSRPTMKKILKIFLNGSSASRPTAVGGVSLFDIMRYFPGSSNIFRPAGADTDVPKNTDPDEVFLHTPSQRYEPIPRYPGKTQITSIKIPESVPRATSYVTGQCACAESNRCDLCKPKKNYYECPGC